MKTIFIKVEVPDDTDIIDVNVMYSNAQRDNLPVTEITLPTEDVEHEIIPKAKKHFKQSLGDWVTGYIFGYKDAIDKIKLQ